MWLIELSIVEFEVADVPVVGGGGEGGFVTE